MSYEKERKKNDEKKKRKFKIKTKTKYKRKKKAEKKCEIKNQYTMKLMISCVAFISQYSIHIFFAFFKPISIFLFFIAAINSTVKSITVKSVRANRKDIQEIYDE